MYVCMVDFSFNFRDKSGLSVYRMLRTALNKTWKQHLTNTELYGKNKKNQILNANNKLRFAGYCWRSIHERTSDILH